MLYNKKNERTKYCIHGNFSDVHQIVAKMQNRVTKSYSYKVLLFYRAEKMQLSVRMK